MVVWSVKMKSTAALEITPASGQASMRALGTLFGSGCPIMKYHESYAELVSCSFTLMPRLDVVKLNSHEVMKSIMLLK